MATAIEMGCGFVTQDARIIQFAEHFGRSHGFELSDR